MHAYTHAHTYYLLTFARVTTNIASMLRTAARMATSVLTKPTDYVGASGLTYHFKELIQQRPHLGGVWIAETRTGQFLLKDVPKSYFQNFNEDIRPRLSEHPNLRLPVDVVPKQHIFIYNYLSHDFLSLVRSSLPAQARKRILYETLIGLKELHERDIVHLDIKPDNVVVDCHAGGQETIIGKIQIADFENSVWLQPGKNVEGMLAGNENWRSPEAHVRAKLNKPTDMFSFGIMCIYAILGRVIFGRDKDFDYQESQGNIAPVIRLQRQISYFGDEKGVQGLLEHVGHSDVCEVLRAMWEDRNQAAIPYKHFSTWPEITDECFRDLILKLTNLDPGSRLTAREALGHPWFTTTDA
ncbi:kinase domain-containing protein [Acrodontium crateriforme]|uniref:Kinase domain-containing protein n=1 Tax=Acrodontium crateriforme TaxID=150365 RepID=A0AAQ3M770_9PEZI|nr:kinase domain-containing protein [Acrodontium crateriforme]